MTNRTISKYIKRLNSKRNSELTFTRKISDIVLIAKVWEKLPKSTDEIVGNFTSYNFFFILDESGKCVGAVLDMNSDLHWYIVPNHRKKGHLTKALESAILPYLFYERDEQRITISKGIGNANYIKSKRVAEKLGFTVINDEMTEFLLKKEDFTWKNEDLNEHNYGLDEGRVNVLKKRINYAAQYLNKISDELQMAYNDDDDLSLLSQEVKKYTWKIEDLMWENKK
uniref:GNAT family N-acetyltransferase n=1 Tax=Fulvivirga sp. TaxID=1931237 RepID=UPI0040491B50